MWSGRDPVFLPSVSLEYSRNSCLSSLLFIPLLSSGSFSLCTVFLALIMWPLCMDLQPSLPPGGRFDFSPALANLSLSHSFSPLIPSVSPNLAVSVMFLLSPLP